MLILLIACYEINILFVDADGYLITMCFWDENSGIVFNLPLGGGLVKLIISKCAIMKLGKSF